MSLGPIELLVVKFPGNQFKGEIAPALAELVENGTIRVIDLLFAIKDENGELAIVELSEAGDEENEAWGPVAGDIDGLADRRRRAAAVECAREQLVGGAALVRERLGNEVPRRRPQRERRARAERAHPEACRRRGAGGG